MSNKIREIQRSGNGRRHEVDLTLKIVASFLPALPESARLHSHDSAMSPFFCFRCGVGETPARFAAVTGLACLRSSERAVFRRRCFSRLQICDGKVQQRRDKVRCATLEAGQDARQRSQRHRGA